MLYLDLWLLLQYYEIFILAFSIDHRSYEQKKIGFETKLNISKYCNIFTEKQNFSYQLYAILVYISTNSESNLGHYIVYIHNIELDQWIEYDDSKVTQLDSYKELVKKVKKANISGLFYIKENVFNDFKKNHIEYLKTCNLFCNQSFIDEYDIDDNLSINEKYDEYRSYSSTTSDIQDFVENNDDSDYSYDLDTGDIDSIQLDESEKSVTLFENDDDDDNDVICINGRQESNHDKSKDINSFESIPDTFQHGPIDYVDSRPHGNLDKYLKEAPPIPNDKNKRPKHVQIDLSDEHIQKLANINQKQKVCEQNKEKIMLKPKKRLYVKTSQAQREQLQKLYNTYQDTWPTKRYAVETGIREKNCEYLIKRLRKNESLDFKTNQRGRPPKINADTIRIMESSLAKDPFLTLKDLQYKLKKDKNIEVSKTQIWENIVGNTDIAKRSNSYVYSFKMASRRDPKANSPENKILRKQRMKELNQCIVDGYEWVCVDETRFDVGYIRMKGWGKKNKRLYIHRKGFSCSGLTAIGPNGMLYCTLVRGKVTAEIYDAFLDHLTNELKNDGPIVFWMDNARIHEHAQEKYKNSMHKVIYNAPYSPEMNPIENIFGIWKDKITKEIVNFGSEKDLIDLIQKTFTKIEPAEIRKTLENIRWTIFPKADELDDL